MASDVVCACDEGENEIKWKIGKKVTTGGSNSRA